MPQSWPRWSPSRIRRAFPKGSLLEGLELNLWETLGHEEFGTMFLQLSSKKTKGKQLVIRKALLQLECGWIATNTTPFRITVGGLFDAAEEAWMQKSSKDPTEQCLRNRNIKRQRRNATPILLKSNAIPELSTTPNQSVQFLDRTNSMSDRKTVWKHLTEYGACVIRNSISQELLEEVIRQIHDQGNQKSKMIELRETMGNGKSGMPPSTYVGLKLEQYAPLKRIETHIWDLLVGEGSPHRTLSAIPTRKSILLQYGDGAENWAHQDSNKEDIPIQALLLLSDPANFSGGEFYVARLENDNELLRNEITLRNPGDLILFNGGNNWWHGMLPIHAMDKSTERFVREAIGMLQPS